MYRVFNSRLGGLSDMCLQSERQIDIACGSIPGIRDVLWLCDSLPHELNSPSGGMNDIDLSVSNLPSLTH